MSHQCPFPVRSTDSRCCYQTGGASGLALCLAVVAALSCFVGFSHAAPFMSDEVASRAAVSSAEPAADIQGGPTLQD